MNIRWIAGLVLSLLTILIASYRTDAHEVRPAYLEFREQQVGDFEVLFKTPMQGDARLALTALFSGHVENLTPVISRPTGDAMVQTWRMRALEPLPGQSLLIDGLSSTMTDALVRVQFADGSSWTERLTPGNAQTTIPVRQSLWSVAVTYVEQGIEHILLGFDHLLFVFALMLIVRNWRLLVKTITAFTVAHSITLTLATFGAVSLPSKPVEASIALSILLVAAEVVRMEQGKTSLAITRPWQVAFVFGLLHGFGFAGALIELGLPHDAVPLALLSFNIGVEIGQLMVIALMLLVSAVVQRIFTLPRKAAIFPAYAIGMVAAFWSIGRVTAMLVR